MNSLKLQLGSLADAVASTIRDAQQQDVIARIWQRDPSLWKTDPSAEANIRSSLGWLTVAGEMIGVVDELTAYAQLVREQGFRHVMVCGMGGSSLCPEVLRRSFGSVAGFPELTVLDSTDPDVLADLAQRLDIERCLFIIASKSGSTIEPTVFYRFWYDYLQKRKSNPGENFIAITDPGSPLIETAKQLGFQKTFLNQADIGGRFSALSYFGMVPAVLAGIDIKTLLERADNFSRSCSHSEAHEQNPGLQLGAILSECANAKRDKLTLVIDDGIASLGLWIEQLVAESTGKEGKGIVPIAGETLGSPSVYESDRVFVSMSIGELDNSVEQKLAALAQAGHPVVNVTLSDLYDLGAAFFLWEFATAVAGWPMQINPFDQPDVQVAKLATNDVLKVFKAEKRLPERKRVAEDQLLTLFVDEEQIVGNHDGEVGAVLQSHLKRSKSGDYIAVLSYIEETSATEALMQQLQQLLRDKTLCASTTSYGPRYLHSTGQLHKGGPDKGVFLQIIANDAVDFPVPAEDYSFSILKQAQAAGDFRALARRGRRILGIDIRDNGITALKHLLDLLAS
jgi:transaldolase / glucose-6-phosphate isomerase